MSSPSRSKSVAMTMSSAFLAAFLSARMSSFSAGVLPIGAHTRYGSEAIFQVFRSTPSAVNGFFLGHGGVGERRGDADRDASASSSHTASQPESSRRAAEGSRRRGCGPSTSDISRMGRLVEAMEECVRSDPPRILAYQELNASFHDVPTEAAGHKRLKHMLQRLHNQIRYFSYQTLSDRDHIERSCHYHRKICEAFTRGDLEETIRLSRDHVLDALNDFTKKFVLASQVPVYDTSGCRFWRTLIFKRRGFE